MKTLDTLVDLKNKNILLRVDFDVPLGPDGAIREPFRIAKQKEVIDVLAERGARLVLVAHISAADSFANLIPQLHMLLGRELGFIKAIEDIPGYLAQSPGVGLLENVRSWPGEKDNDAAFAKRLAEGFHYYVNNAFAVCHRDHASVSAITKFLPAYAGSLVVQEMAGLDRAINAPAAGKVVIMGGAKASTKVPVIKHFLDKAEHILVGGVIANDILKGQGKDFGSSLVDEDAQELLAGMDVNDPKLVIPEDFVVSEGRFLDIGAAATKRFADIISGAAFIIWNGPMGMFEDERFAAGTDAVAQAIISSGAFSVIGGGDTIMAVSRLGLRDHFGFVSTGGGAMLAYLAGQELPGLVALR